MVRSVYLIGGRAVGKSTIGERLAARLGHQFLDTDEQISKSCGATITEIVRDEGWSAFRTYERELLASLVGQKGLVVATGGGAILHRGQWQELRQQALVIWLRADLEILKQRIGADLHSASLRPSLTGGDVAQELAEVLQERNPLYEESAHKSLDGGQMSITDAVTALEEMCRSTRTLQARE